MDKKEQAVNDDLIDKSYRKFVKKGLLLGTILIIIGAFFVLLGYSSDLQNFIYYSIGVTLIFIGLFIRKNTKSKSYQLAAYHPQCGFKFYRKATEERIKIYTILRVIYSIVFILLVVLYLWKGEKNLLSIIRSILWGLFGFICITALKDRIKFHQNIDDATYFELEELGLISENDSVAALYKDFSSWSDVKKNSKILILTMDELVVLNFKDNNSATKNVFSISKVNRLGFFRIGQSRQGYALSIGFQNNLLRIILSGSSYQDSPEEFFSIFLKKLDDKLLQRSTASNRPKRNTSPTISENLNRIRKIEVEKANELWVDDTSVHTKRVIDL